MESDHEKETYFCKTVCHRISCCSYCPFFLAICRPRHGEERSVFPMWESTDRCAADAASEVWEKETLYGEWVMFVSFRDDHAVKSSIFLDLGEAEGNCTRISVRKDGQWRFSLSGLTLVFKSAHRLTMSHEFPFCFLTIEKNRMAAQLLDGHSVSISSSSTAVSSTDFTSAVRSYMVRQPSLVTNT